MEIFDSLELRWFLPEQGETVDGVRRWFASTAPQGPRLDEYLLTGRDDLGFKVRGQKNVPTKVEIKYRLASPQILTLAPGVVGKLERWRKLSLPLEDAELRRNGSWIALHKLRRLQEFAYDGKTAARVAPGTPVEAGCGLELTELSYRLSGDQRPREGTTLGLEAFGREDLLLEALQSTFRVTLGAGLELALGDDRSMSYPEWLGSLEKSR